MCTLPYVVNVYTKLTLECHLSLVTNLFYAITAILGPVVKKIKNVIIEQSILITMQLIKALIKLFHVSWWVGGWVGRWFSSMVGSWVI